MLVAIICEKTGWTYEEFLRQPQWLIEIMVAKMIEDAREEQKELKKLK